MNFVVLDGIENITSCILPSALLKCSTQKIVEKVSILGMTLWLFSATSIAANNATGFNDGWCIGRSTLILYAYPTHRSAQDVYFQHSQHYILSGLNQFGATTENRDFLLEGLAEIKKQVLRQAQAFVVENGIEALNQDIDEIYIPEMLRRCDHDTRVMRQ